MSNRIASGIMRLRSAPRTQHPPSCPTAGEFLRLVKDFVSGTFNIEPVLNTAFDGIGSLSLSTVEAVRKAKEKEVKVGRLAMSHGY